MSTFYEWLFGPEDKRSQMDIYNDALGKAILELDEQIYELQHADKATLKEISKLAKKPGSEELVKLTAKQLIRDRRMAVECATVKLQIKAIQRRLKAAQNTHTITMVLAGTAQMMHRVNGTLGNAGLRNVMKVFERENKRLDKNVERLERGVNSFAESDGDDIKEQELLEQVYIEAGMDETHALRQALSPPRTTIKNVDGQQSNTRVAQLAGGVGVDSDDGGDDDNGNSNSNHGPAPPVSNQELSDRLDALKRGGN
jgi:charged multivesicular body protein 2A